MNISFIDQLNKKAGLGCHIYHITMIGKIQNAFKSLDNINDYLQGWTKDLDYINLFLAGKMKITSTGKVLLLVESDTLKHLSCDMYTDLRKDHDFDINGYFNTRYFHITLGIITNKKLFGRMFHLHNLRGEKFYPNSLGWDY